MDATKDAIGISRKLCRDVNRLKFGPPVTNVYNPLQYARVTSEIFLERFAQPRVEGLLLGMNPGPWGMSQTGVPFGEIEHVRDWMGITGKVKRPKNEHAKRPVQGFDCLRKEVSGARLWGWAKERFGTAEAFFERFFVWNYCPLVFLEESGRNRTPDKLPLEERQPLEAICDAALVRFVEWLQPEHVIGIGKFAQKRAQRALGDEYAVHTVLHPSPASPLANRGWAPQVESQLRALGIRL